MTLHLTSCERAPDPTPGARMSAAEFTARLPQVAYPEYWFADYTGANVRTVQRWASGEQDIPLWVPRFLTLHERLCEALAWASEREVSEAELAWRCAAHEALWVARGREPR